MKKIICFILTLAMIFGCTISAFADSKTFPDIATSDNKEAIQVLANLGVVAGYPDGTFGPKNNITRAQVATLLVRALGYGPYVSGIKDSGFTDVSSTHWAVGYIAWAKQLGIVDGVGNNKFEPDRSITNQEMIAIVLKALGYKASVLKGTWPLNFIMKAYELKVCEGITPNAEVAVREDVAQMIYNVLNTPMVSVNIFGIAAPYSDNRTLLSCLDAKKEVGIATLDETIVANNYKAIGQYCIKIKDSDSKLVSLIPTSTQITGSVSNGAFVFDNTNYKLATNATKSAVAFVNNQVVPMATFSALVDDEDVVTFNVELDGNTITTLYSVMLWTPTKSFEVTKADLMTSTTTSIKGYNLISSSAIYGVDSLADIKVGNVVTLYCTTDKAITKVEVGTKVLVGVPTRIHDGEYLINDTYYESKVNLTLGTTYELHFTYDNVIFSKETIKEATVSAIIYGFFKAQDTVTSFGETKTTVRINTVNATTVDAITLVSVPTTPTDLYKYTLDKAGKINAVEAVPTASSVTYTGIALHLDNKTYRVAADCNVIAVVSEGGVFTYKLTTIDKVEKNVNVAATSGSAYLLNDDYKVSLIVVSADHVSGTKDIGYVVINNIDAIYLNSKICQVADGFIDGKAISTMVLADTIVTTNMELGGVYKVITNNDGMLSAEKATPTDFTADEVLDDYGFWNNTAKTYVLVDEDVVVYKYTAKGYVLSSMNNIVAPTSVALYDTNADGAYDIVVWNLDN